MPAHPDPFRDARQADGLLSTEFNGVKIPFVLSLQGVRKAAKDWQTFSSDHPFKVVPRSEERLRRFRQLPIETDPPAHTEYRSLVEPIFRKATQEAYQRDIQALVQSMVAEALAAETVEVVRDFSLPLQCRALTRLLGLPEAEAELWASWGLHVFNEGDGEAKGRDLEAYIDRKLAETAANPGDDMFSILNQATFRGRTLTFEEKCGFANLAFAGGRDTIINVVSSILAYLAEHPESLAFLREDASRITTATEEFVRYVSPVTAIARSCPHAARVAEREVAAGSRIGLCWPSANRDESIFKDADQVVLDRKPNPHVGFGFGAHNCLGAAHARLVIRTLLAVLCEQVSSLKLLDYEETVERESSYARQVGYESATIRWTA